MTLLAVLVVEYFVVPTLIGATKDLRLLAHVDTTWLIAATMLEAASLLAYALLTRTLLGDQRLGLATLLRITLATAGMGHLMPGGTAAATGLGYRLLTARGVAGAEAGFVLLTGAIGSAVVLNILLWIALVVSVPCAGMHPIYAVIASVGVLALAGVFGLVYAFTRGEEQAVRVARAIGGRVPRLGTDRAEHLLRQVADAVGAMVHNRPVLRHALLWASLNWLLDAASLWSFVAAFGHLVNPVELFAAYGIANVLAAIPITPGGLGVVEASAASLLAGCGLAQPVAALSVLGWRLVNFWLPIPLGAVAYASLVAHRRRTVRAPASAAGRQGRSR